MPPANRNRNPFGIDFEAYKQVGERMSTRMDQMEHHLKELVQRERMGSARVQEDELRIVRPTTQNLQTATLTWTPPQGEAWLLQRISLATTSAGEDIVWVCYRDYLAATNIAEVCLSVQQGIGFTIDIDPSGANPLGVYSDSFSNRLYLPERTSLVVQAYNATSGAIVPTPVVTMDGNIQVKVLKRHLHPINTEEEFELDGASEDEYEAFELGLQNDKGGKPEPGRHHSPEDDEDSRGMGFAPDVDQRPAPHFAEQILETIEDAAHKTVAELHLRPEAKTEG